jgi:hypothetical protein
MASLNDVLRELRQEHNQAQLQVEKLDKAISAIEGLAGGSVAVAANGTRPQRRMSAAGRRRIAEAQRARWAKLRKPSQPAVSAKSAVSSSAATPAKRKLSPAGRRRIIAAAKARWARVRAQQNKKAA